jgi:hypothetical protein
MTGTLLRREECGILLDMDASFRRAYAAEADAIAEREKPAEAKRGRR